MHFSGQENYQKYKLALLGIININDLKSNLALQYWH